MPDDKIYGFNREDTIELLNKIGNEDAEFPEQTPREIGGGGKWIQGELTALDDGEDEYTGLQVGTITVVVASCGHSSLIGESVEVVDHSGCIFDHEFEDLDGVWVWASWGVAESTDPEASEGELTPCHWVADDRCCVAADTGA